jgi:hypothetical protein
MTGYSRQVAFAGAIALMGLASATRAGESGGGLTIPGSQAFGAGSTPPAGVYVTLGSLYYDGRISATLEGGRLDLNARKTAFPTLVNLLWVLPVDVMGGRLGISGTMPFASFTRLGVEVPGLGQAAVRGWGIGDASVKAQLGWTHGEFSHTVSTSAWFPTGRYDTGFAANAGKNHVGFNLTWGFTQIWKDPGIELSAALGVTSEMENHATHYRNGTALNLDAAIGKVFANGLTVGVAGYAYSQISADKGRGATLGSFRGQTLGLGPAVAYSTLLGGRPVSFAVRHYREFAVENRFRGHMTTLTATTRF